ncbi:hypothetical protein N3K66_003883 [Trichothecium roseum]|uniref:Uncharacterized protein n=1 Tax=Trichothecium roseum TaxID=47278 RepID=A0ACC0V6N4_9HYPO|nr:hypothetical protein N3K66_003883 [Trichothecium roseum]
MKIRNAGPDDLPAVVKVILAAINKERLWTNFVPKKGAQDAAYLHEIEKLLKEHLDPKNKDWVISVVDLADSANSPPRIAAVAVWDMSAADDDKETNRKNVKTTITDDRLEAYTSVVLAAREAIFDKKYSSHRYLQLLAVHPDHQGQGHGKHLVQKAILNAKTTGGVLTTIGGPHGYIFFSGLGFHDLGPITLPESSATDARDIKALGMVIKKEERRASLVDSLLNYISG